MHTELLFNTLNTIKPLSIHFKTYLKDNLIPINFMAGDIISYQLQRPEMVYFVVYGLASGTSVADNKIKTAWFCGEGHFIIPVFTKSGKPCTERIEFLTSTLLIGLNSQSIVKATTLFPEATPIFASVIDMLIREANERELFLRMDAKDRYHYLLETAPYLFRTTSTARLASYINTSTRHFERIKNGK